MKRDEEEREREKRRRNETEIMSTKSSPVWD